MDNLNNATFTTYLNNLDQTGCNSFAADLNANFVGAFGSRFVLTPRQNSALTTIAPYIQPQFVSVAQWVSSGLAQGALAADIIGVAFDSNPTGSAQLDTPVHGSGSGNITIGPGGKVTVSGTITINF